MLGNAVEILGKQSNLIYSSIDSVATFAIGHDFSLLPFLCLLPSVGCHFLYFSSRSCAVFVNELKI